jgi:hypothetical protein
MCYTLWSGLKSYYCFTSRSAPLAYNPDHEGRLWGSTLSLVNVAANSRSSLFFCKRNIFSIEWKPVFRQVEIDFMLRIMRYSIVTCVRKNTSGDGSVLVINYL